MKDKTGIKIEINLEIQDNACVGVAESCNVEANEEGDLSPTIIHFLKLIYIKLYISAP